ncbi:hypothetical protein R4Y45_06265 [Holzapfeliella sp. He02]|uniref:Uncharacterized protein n=1 Tax=Holzapfeliella saturejae TaxID=3082953 RepID=A0ABU8SHK6_9LACO
MKTVRELAEEIGVSKQAVARYIRSHKKEVDKHLKKEKQTFLLDEELQSTIKQHFERNRYKRTDNTKANQQQTDTEPVQTDTRTESEPATNPQQEIIDILKKQVESQQKELESRDREIEKVHSLLDQQQRLTLQTNSSIDTLREENEHLKRIENEPNQNRQQTSAEPVENQQRTDTPKPWWKFWK